MAFNPGPLICSITAAVTHNQRVIRNSENKNEIVSSSEVKKVMTNYQPVTSQKEMLEELKRVLEDEICKDEYSVSIYDVLKLMRKKYDECSLLDRRLCWYINQKTDYDVSIYSHDAENKCLIIWENGRIYFTKKDGDLIVEKSEYYNAKDILAKCGDEIAKRYDKFIEDIGFYCDYFKNIKSINSNFVISSDEYRIYITNSNNFEISAKIYEDEYNYNCNSNNITSICRNNEDEIFKKIFIKIEDCPEWMRTKLFEIRHNQLIEKQKREKRLELKRKFFPFLKNNK